MAKRAICDVCRKDVELSDPYGQIPDTWYHLRRGCRDELHICSTECLALAVEERRARELDAAQRTEAAAIA